jgi:hypothetical protein
MATIIILDLPQNEELDREAMASVRGGFHFGTGDNSQSQAQPGTSPGNPSVSRIWQRSIPTLSKARHCRPW